ncbi:DNA topoisomerase III [Rheinheimera sp.]|uniref:DNA topoisomerase III n=1 Tax=Rheinheimera sp. TaxID=1869214 RepID=UPI0027B88966|nr:DNA topoisomerase III [Rheinheimera sp.]
MILYIAEKPSLGRAIAAVLSKPQRNGDGFIELGNGDIVSWCIGHLLEQAEPEVYNSAFKKWQLQHLPIVPQVWQLKARASSAKQLSVLKKLIQQADQLVHAGDPDREGQLLVDEVIAYCGVKGDKLKQSKRLLINDLNPPAILRALQNLKPNSDFVPLSTSALARSRADWLYGLNMTRAYTLQGQKAGFQGVLSVGRVQTPVLGLVVRRDAQIEHFVSKPFYQVLAHLQLSVNDNSTAFVAKWLPSAACEPYQDEEGRVLHPGLADKVARSITAQPALVTKLEQKNKKQYAPLPYNLSALQIDAAKKYGMAAQQVLDLTQQLYERYQLVTYPRSDCRYLPKEQLAAVSTISSTLSCHNSELAQMVAQADFSLVSKAWDDKEVGAHHAIIPTEKAVDASRLSADLQKIYGLIARQYLLQFYPPYCYGETTVELNICGGLFRTIAKTEQQQGWKQWFGKNNHHEAKQQHSATDRQQATDQQNAEQDQLLPPLKEGQQLFCARGETIEKHTQPPEHFTDATLLAAMTGISRFVEDPAIKQILRDTDGLGTEATRAGIIELLFKRGFLVRHGKNILATATGKSLIAALPESTSKPDMTAQWEAALLKISQKELSYQAFMQPLLATLNDLISNAHHAKPEGLPTDLKPKWQKRTGRRTVAGAGRKPDTFIKTPKTNRPKKTTSNNNS